MNRKKIIKRVALVIASVLGLFLILIFAVGIYVGGNKEKLLSYARTELQQKMRGRIKLGNLDISVLSHFPSVTFSVDSFSISDTVYNKPLISVQSMSTSFNVFDLIFSRIEVSNIRIRNGTFHIFTDSNGYSNNYLLQSHKNPANTERRATARDINISLLEVEDLSVTVEDKRANKEISMQINKLNAGISQKGLVAAISMDEKITMKKGLGFNLDKGAYLENQVLEGIWKLTFNSSSKTLSFDKSIVTINQHPYELSGLFSFSNDQRFLIKLHTDELPFQNAKDIVTAAIRSKIEQIQIVNPITVDGVIDGSLLPHHEPYVNIDWKTQKNTLVTKVVSFTDCSFEGNFNNSVNKDSAHTDPNSRITFSVFHGNWDGIGLSGKDISITNLLKPVIHLDLHSTCSFAALDDKFALRNIHLLDGNAELRLFYDGPLTKDKSMLQEMEGELNINDGTIQYEPRNMLFTHCNGEVGFYKDSISLRRFHCEYLKNKLNIEMQGKNIRRNFVVKDDSQLAQVKCYINSSYINLEDFTPLFAAKKNPHSRQSNDNFRAFARRIDELLENSIIEIFVKADQIRHKRLEARNMDGDIKFLPGHWELARVSFNFANGSIFTTGRVVHTLNNNHLAVVSTAVNHVELDKLLYAFDNFGQDAITFRNLRGRFTTKANFKAGINSEGKMIPGSLYGKVNFSLQDCLLSELPALQKLKVFVFKNRDFSKVKVAEIKDRLDIRGTNIYVNRMEIESSIFRLFVEGNYGMAGKNTELLIQVPFSNLNSNSFDSLSPKNRGIRGTDHNSVWLRAENSDSGKISLKITLRKKLKSKGKV